MITLTSSLSLEVLLAAAPTTQCDITASFADFAEDVYEPGETRAQTNGVHAVEAVPTPPLRAVAVTPTESQDTEPTQPTMASMAATAFGGFFGSQPQDFPDYGAVPAEAVPPSATAETTTLVAPKRLVDFVSIYNPNGSAVTVTVRIRDKSKPGKTGEYTICISTSLGAGASLQYNHSRGWS